IAWPTSLPTPRSMTSDRHRCPRGSAQAHNGIEAAFDASPERVWQLWADPRQLERWWGPPNYPATVTQHNLAPGGRVEYGIIGPLGDRHRGYWEILEAEPPHRLVFRDGLASGDG